MLKTGTQEESYTIVVETAKMPCYKQPLLSSLSVIYQLYDWTEYFSCHSSDHLFLTPAVMLFLNSWNKD